MQILTNLFGAAMRVCHTICGNYGLAIILFTLFSKLVLLPVSVWVQKNSIKMVEMQPAINRIRAQHFGDTDTITEKQTELFKENRYSPFASLVPLALQIILLLGVVAVVKTPETYITDPGFSKVFLGFDLSAVASLARGKYILMPVLAAFTAWILCVVQNAVNVLQSEQSKWNKYGFMIFSVSLSLYLGFFVQAGVALYWMASNLFAVLQQFLLNMAINPKKYVDYEALEESRRELQKMQQYTGGAKKRSLFKSDPHAEREAQDYRRFFETDNKHIVFYSESNGFYKYYAGMIDYLIRQTNMPVHYVTSDPEDTIFARAGENPRFHAYYIGNIKLIPFMMKMDADVVVMTMPDLENYQIKRSIVRKDIEYVYVPHGMDSLNLTMRTASMDHYDTILVSGRYQREEIEKTEEVYGLPKKKLISCGYPLLDDMRRSIQTDSPGNERPVVLIAPSWQKDNIVDLCLDELLTSLKDTEFDVIVRPHPQHVRHMPERMEQLKAQYAEAANVTIQTDFSSTDTVYKSDLLITDWSGIATEFAFTTLRPVLFIDTPMKVMNPEYERIGVTPINIWMRDVLGKVVPVSEAGAIAEPVRELIQNADRYRAQIADLAEDCMYNHGSSAEVAGEYLVRAVAAKVKERGAAQ